MKKCIICEKEITINSKYKKYCSQVCNNKAFRERNRERYNEIRRKSYHNHKDTQHQSNRRNYLNHHQQRLDSVKQYREKNSEKVKNCNQKYRFVHNNELKSIKQLHRQRFNDYWKKELFCDHCGALYSEKELQFHHLNPKTKKYGLSQMEYKSNLEILAELAKCIVLCENCHSTLHANIRWGNPIFA